MLTVAELNRDLNKLKEERKKAWFGSIEEKVVGVEGVTRKWGQKEKRFLYDEIKGWGQYLGLSSPKKLKLNSGAAMSSSAPEAQQAPEKLFD